MGQCKGCVDKRNKRYRSKNKEARLKRDREYYYKNRERILNKKRQYNRDNAEESRSKASDRAKKQTQNRTEFLRNYKEAAGCLDCRVGYPHYILEFDHREGEEKIGPVGSLKRISMEKLMGEIDKCDVVCANCHRARTWERSQNGN